MSARVARVAIRAAVGADIGLGHVMRCLALARALRAAGVEPLFIGPEPAGRVRALLERAEIPWHCYSAGSDVAHQAADAQEAIRILRRVGEVALVVVDDYSLDFRWEQPVAATGSRVLVIDDLANRQHDCDLLLDQNFLPDMSSRYDGVVAPRCRLLLGPQWALLRDEFIGHEDRRERTGLIRRVLVTYGGADPHCDTHKAVIALRSTSDIERVDVVIGAYFDQSANPEAFARGDARFRFHAQPGYMADLMREADLVVGAGGSTSWERCALGAPALVTAVADNQVATSRYLAETGAIVYLGESPGVSESDISQAVARLMGSPERVRNMGIRARSVMGDSVGGAHEVVRVILEVLGD